MKKLLGAVLVAALVFPSGLVSAELLKNLKVGGQVDLQAVSANNATDFNSTKYDQAGDLQTRVMLNTDWDLLDDVHSKISITKNNRAWGTGSETVAVNGSGAAGPVFTIDQAYMKVDKMVGNVDSTLGRQFYGTPGDLVVYYGPKDNLYGLGVTALDAARFDWANDHMGLVGLVGKISSPGLTATGSDAGAVDIRGLRATCKVTGITAYLYNRVSHLSTAGLAPVANDYLYVFGIRGGYTWKNLSLKGELAKDFGQNRPSNTNYTGTALLADASYKAEWAGFGGVNPWFNFGIGSGGASANRVFTPIAGDYRPGGIYGLFAPGATATLGTGIMGAGTTVSSNSLGDRVIWGLGVKANPSAYNKLTAALSLWDYSYQTAIAGASGTPAAAAGNRHIGSEIDLDATWAKSDNVSVGAGVGTFQPGNAISTAQPGSNPATLARMNVTVKF